MIIEHPALAGFHAALDDNNECWSTRLVMADWYEEQNDSITAQAIRWQVKRRKRPLCGERVPRSISLWAWYDEAQAVWDFGPYRRRRWDPKSDLPHLLWDELLLVHTLRLAMAKKHWKCWTTRRLAEEALWGAWRVWKGL